MKSASGRKTDKLTKPAEDDARAGGSDLFDHLGHMQLNTGQHQSAAPVPPSLGGAHEAPIVGGDPLGQLLGDLTGAGGSDQSGDLLAGLLSGLGGGTASTGGGLGDLLGMLGGGAQVQGGGDPLGGLFGGLMGGGDAAPSMSGGGVGNALQFFLGKLTSGGVGGGNVGDIVQMLAGGQRVERAHLHTSGLTQEYAQQAGLDHEAAGAELEQVMAVLQQQLGGRRG